MDDDYEVRVLPDGTYALRTPDGRVFPEDPTDIDYCDFLHWLSMKSDSDQARVGYRVHLPSWTYYFAEMQHLIDHLQDYGALVYVTRGPDIAPERVEPGEAITIGTHKYYNLPKAIKWDEDAEFATSSLGGKELSGLRSQPSATYIEQGLFDVINAQISDEDQAIRKLSSWPVERTFVYLDVSDFSRQKSGHQGLIITAIIGLVKQNAWWRTSAIRGVNRKSTNPGIDTGWEAMLCIGDGYIFAFGDPLSATYFAAYLAQLIESVVAKRIIIDFHFRMGVHIGSVFRFWDPGREGWNYVGDGINGGNRVIGAIGKEADDILFISAQVRKRLSGNNSLVPQGLTTEGESGVPCVNPGDVPSRPLPSP
jgi:hypothetical protein